MEPCVDGWVYDKSIFTSSIVTEWDLVCDFWTLKSLSQSIFLCGILVGYLLWGYLSDRFGRRRMLLPSYFLVAVSSTGAAFAQSFPVYCCLRFLLGFFISGTTLGSGTLVMEWTTSQHRPLVAVILALCFSLGYLFLGVLAYGIQEWRRLQLVASIPFFAFFLTSWWLPESAGWLIVHKKYDDALKVLRKVAKINGVKDKTLSVEALRSTMEKELTAEQTHYTILDLIRFPVLRTRILSMSFAGFTTGMLFYGLALDLQNLGSNIQMLQVLFGASGFLSSLGALFVMSHLGRRTVAVACPLLAGLFIPASAWYMGRGLILTIDQTGIMLAPLVNTLRHYIPVLPQIIFALTGITSSFMVFFFLPETKNKPMSDSIEDIECGHSREEAGPRDDGDTTVKISQF